MKNRLTLDDILNSIVKEDYIKMGEKTTVCCATLQNGFEVIGTSSCVDPANYDYEIGKEIAKKEVLDKIWELEGYLLQSAIYNNKKSN